MGRVTEDSISARVVLYGPPGSGKSHTLGLIASKLKSAQRGELREELIEGVPVEVLPIKLGEIKGKRTEFEFVAAPGDWSDGDARRELLKSVDGLIFVANSGGRYIGDNMQSLSELKDYLRGFGKSLVATPVVFQWNHARAKDAIPADELSASLNDVRAPAFPVGENDPRGVFQAFTTISKITLKKVREDYESNARAVEPLEDETATANIAVVRDADIVEDEIPIVTEENLAVTESPLDAPGVVPSVEFDDLEDSIDELIDEEESEEEDDDVYDDDLEEPVLRDASTDELDDAVLRIDRLAAAAASPKAAPADEPSPKTPSDHFPLPATADVSVQPTATGTAAESSATFVPSVEVPSVELATDGGAIEIIGTGQVTMEADGRVDIPVRLRHVGAGEELTITISIRIR